MTLEISATTSGSESSAQIERSRRRWATVIGLTAVVMWASLGTLGVLSQMRPLLLTGIGLGIGFLLGAGRWVWLGEPLREKFRVPLPTLLAGVGGLFGNIVCYFFAMRLAPAAEANLINYTWPLLIVLLSSIVLRERLKWYAWAGMAVAFFGASLATGAWGNAEFRWEHLDGYLCAFGAALIWAAYTVFRRRANDEDTDEVVVFCGLASILALVGHLLFEPRQWPAAWPQWLAILAAGIGPLGAAYFTWDIGARAGNIRVLSAASYSLPLLSTSLLFAIGAAKLHPNLLIAGLLIAGGAMLSSWDALFARSGEREGNNPHRVQNRSTTS